MRILDCMKGLMVLGVFGLVLGCATSEDVKILDQEIIRLQSQLNLMQKEGESLKRDLSLFQEDQKEIKKDVSTLRTNMDNEMKKLQADLLLRIENLQSEVRILSTGIEEYKQFMKRPVKEVDREKEDFLLRTKRLEEREKIFEEKNKILEEQNYTLREKISEIGDRLKRLEGKIAELSLKPIEAEKASLKKETPTQKKTAITTVENLYKDAYDTFQKGNLEEARKKFEAFLKQYPNTDLSDNAQFWIGETYYLKKDYEKAILEYEKAIVKYPEGDKTPAALFKQALAFLELGDKMNARNLLRRVIEKYPHSEQSDMAKKRLEGIK